MATTTISSKNNSTKSNNYAKSIISSKYANVYTPSGLNAAILVFAIIDFLNSTKNKYYFDNTKSMNSLYAEIVHYITNAFTRNKFTNDRDTRIGLKNYLNIDSGKDLAEIFSQYSAELTKKNFKCNKVVKSKNSKKTNTQKIKSISQDMCNLERSIAVRSKFGGYEVKFYNLHGTTNKNPELNEIKQAYHYETGCNYYLARPILYSTWLKLSPERQNSTTDVEVVEHEII